MSLVTKSAALNQKNEVENKTRHSNMTKASGSAQIIKTKINLIGSLELESPVT
jgi:hypothetical protein